MMTCINKDKHDNSAGTANETVLSSSGGGGGRQSDRRGGIGVPPNNRLPKKEWRPPKEYWEGIRRRFAPLWACLNRPRKKVL